MSRTNHHRNQKNIQQESPFNKKSLSAIDRRIATRKERMGDKESIISELKAFNY